MTLFIEYILIMSLILPKIVVYFSNKKNETEVLTFIEEFLLQNY
jgi:hypothetical protein